ncbi:MAG TPA: hypothetical protein ENI80_03395 [Acidiferrobacteraceae bacterium]|nr:hypothetical protein [Acidiferrobacteraceae bacterium]
MKRDEMMLMLGGIQSDLKAIKKSQSGSTRRLNSIDGRLRGLEIKSARIGGISGGVSGGVISVGIALILESMKSLAKGGT